MSWRVARESFSAHNCARVLTSADWQARALQRVRPVGNDQRLHGVGRIAVIEAQGLTSCERPVPVVLLTLPEVNGAEATGTTADLSSEMGLPTRKRRSLSRSRCPLKLSVGQPHAEPATRHALRFLLLQLMKVASALISWPLTVAWTLVNLPVMDRVHWSNGAAVDLPRRQGGLDAVG